MKLISTHVQYSRGDRHLAVQMTKTTQPLFSRHKQALVERFYKPLAAMHYECYTYESAGLARIELASGIVSVAFAMLSVTMTTLSIPSPPHPHTLSSMQI